MPMLHALTDDDTVDPVAALRTHHRRLLDRQAELGIEVRALGARLSALTTEAGEIAAAIKRAGAIITIATTPTAPQSTPATAPAPPRRGRPRTRQPIAQPVEAEPEPTFTPKDLPVEAWAEHDRGAAPQREEPDE